MNKDEWINAYIEGLRINSASRGCKTRRQITDSKTEEDGYFAARAHGQYLSREEVQQWINQQN